MIQRSIVGKRLVGNIRDQLAMVEDAQLRNFRPTFVIDHQGVRQYSDAPMLLVGRNSDVDAAQAISAASPGGIGSSSN